MILSKKVDITNNQWKIFKPTILSNNDQKNLDKLIFESNFDLKKINGLFSNLSSLTFFELKKLRKDYIIL